MHPCPDATREVPQPAPGVPAEEIRGDGRDAVHEIGGTDRRLRIIAFAAGGVDAAFEFGLVHAMLVSGAAPPHVITGISAGGVMAACLADVLLAGDESGSSDAKETEAARQERDRARVARFRQLLDRIHAAPSDFIRSTFPDLTEISARAGLKPLQLPTHGPTEAAAREGAARTRFGLVQLLNGFLALRLRISELTRVIRLGLEVPRLIEWSAATPGRACRCFGPILVLFVLFRLWLRLAIPVIRDAPIMLHCLEALVRSPGGRARTHREARLFEWGDAFCGTRSDASPGSTINGPETRCGRLFDVVERLVHLFRRLDQSVVAWLDPKLRHAIQILFEPRIARWLLGMLAIAAFPVMAGIWFLAPFIGLAHVVVSKWCTGISRRRRAWLALAATLLFAGLSTFVIRDASQDMRWAAPFLLGKAGAQLPPKFGHHGFEQAWGWGRFLLEELLVLFLHWIGWGLTLFIGTIAALVRPGSCSLVFRFLRGFDLQADLLATDSLRQLLIRILQLGYADAPPLTRALQSVFAGSCSARPESDLPPTATLGDWLRRPGRRGILVVPVAADLSNGSLVCLPPVTAKLDALTAACAMSPLFRPQQVRVPSIGGIRDLHLIDAANISREPLAVILELVRALHCRRVSDPQPGGTPDVQDGFAGCRLAPSIGEVEICVVSPLPTGRLMEREQAKARSGFESKAAGTSRPVTDTQRGAGTLRSIPDLLAWQAAHSTKDERSLVTAVNQAIGAAALPAKDPRRWFEGSFFYSGCLDDETQRRDPDCWHVRAGLREIEPILPIRLIPRLVACDSDSERRNCLGQTIADGCWSSLRRLYPETIQAKAASRKGTAACHALMTALGRTDSSPGVETTWPGIPEVCVHCRFHRDPEATWEDDRPPDDLARPAVTAAPGGDWPHERLASTDSPERPLRSDSPPPGKEDPPEIPPWASSWPRRRGPELRPSSAPGPDRERPTVSLVLSGGVFRGVFQVGVLNALMLAGIKPDIVAGASIGTILAAMSARVLHEPDPNRQRHRMAMLSATFLGVDRLVLTDRFADFIRRFTLRAGRAHISPRDMDGLFRTYDQRNWEQMSRRSRLVLAGLQRLFYLTPFELLDQLGMNAPHRRGLLKEKFLDNAQKFLDRAGIGEELLGTEPLQLLIREHVLRDPSPGGHQPAVSASFAEFTSSGVQLLGATTNIATGELDLLGSHGDPERVPALLPGLLASSAFPAVFRPRKDWELWATAAGLPQELVDGGISDNLPLMPVARFLQHAASSRITRARPVRETTPTPHLLFTASLEVERHNLATPRETEETARSWAATSRHAARLRYNVKVDNFSKAQLAIRQILKHSPARDAGPGANPDLHAICVKPKWLCGTFGFHPMLGFRRVQQAESIAHGCASTLTRLHREQSQPGQEQWAESWWTAVRLRPGVASAVPNTDAMTLEPDVEMRKPGNTCKPGSCFFAADYLCPFSEPELRRVNARSGESAKLQLPDSVIQALSSIYDACGRRTTHQSKPPSQP